jgi:cytochrome c oxidase cbb3-type subunit 3
MKKNTNLFFSLTLSAIVSGAGMTAVKDSYADEQESSQNEAIRGAFLFGKYCTLCHGEDGLGEGVLSMRLGTYPSTNLLDPDHRFKTKERIKSAIIEGGSSDGIDLHESMPPYGAELSESDIDAVASFISYLRSETEPAITLLRQKITLIPLRRTAGRDLFKSHCVLCHGQKGLGDGRMARMLKAKKLTPPANLTLSRLPDESLFEIISKGGAAVGRSSFMPTWEEQLTVRQRKAIIKYIKSLRTY